MKKYAKLLAVLLIVLAGVAVAEETYFIFGTETQAPAQGTQESAWTFPVPREILEDPLDLLVLANRQNPLDKGYPPKDELHALVEPTVKKTKNVEMPARTIANDALTEMFAAAKEDGANLLLHSGYRSHYTQSVLYENKVKADGRDTGYVLPGGASEHQTGLSFDIVNKDFIGKKFDNKFAESVEGQWLAANCAQFGFIIRYPDGKFDITGVKSESWHVRYVGREVAEYITQNGLTLEEFDIQRREALEK